MNYRHAFHAGNFADVVKHLALVCILLHLRKKDAAFAVIDSHAGRGLYDLRGAEAQRTGEAAKGIGRILALHEPAVPPALQTYLAIVKRAGDGMYPGSPLIAASLLRAQDRLVAIEQQDDEAAALRTALAPFRDRARLECADGYARLNALLPPVERRGVVLIDPPFEAPDEFQREAHALRDALRRFANGIYLLWFPIKSAGEASAFSGEVLATGARKILRVDVAVATATETDKERLTSAGLIIANPPFGFASEIQENLAHIAPLFSAAARVELRWLIGEER